MFKWEFEIYEQCLKERNLTEYRNSLLRNVFHVLIAHEHTHTYTCRKHGLKRQSVEVCVSHLNNVSVFFLLLANKLVNRCVWIIIEFDLKSLFCKNKLGIRKALYLFFSMFNKLWFVQCKTDDMVHRFY